MLGDCVRQLGEGSGCEHRILLILCQAVPLARVLGKSLAQTTAERLRCEFVQLGILQNLYLRGIVGIFRDHMRNPGARNAGHQEVHRVVLDAEHLPDAADSADGIEILRRYIHNLGVLLRNKQRIAFF
ncbi:hypothetical protein SDC9_148669 [bioreactor metagenome]|uniref:Uncharacterized protein n=1 Tax=bioreactor metagenome TaxID=1076179 RepID=A0A645EJF4_9ZZZZ